MCASWSHRFVPSRSLPLLGRIHTWTGNKDINVSFCFLQSEQTATMRRSSGKHHVCDNQRCRPTLISASACSCSNKDVSIKMAEIKTLRPWGFLSHCVTPTASPWRHFTAPVLISRILKTDFVIPLETRVLLSCDNTSMYRYLVIMGWLFHDPEITQWKKIVVTMAALGFRSWSRLNSSKVKLQCLWCLFLNLSKLSHTAQSVNIVQSLASPMNY